MVLKALSVNMKQYNQESIENIRYTYRHQYETRLQEELMKLVKADIAVAEGSAAPSAQIAVAGPQARLTPEQLAAMPAFAAERADGTDEIPVDPSSLPGPDYVELARLSETQRKSAETDQLFSATRRATINGSSAHQLYDAGLWPEPAGEGGAERQRSVV